MCISVVECSCWFKTSVSLNKSPVDLSVYLLNDKHICLCWFSHCIYGLGLSNNTFFAVSLTLEYWVCLNFAIDPADVIGDSGVDPRLIPLPAPVAPADHTHQSHPVIVPTDERAARVALQVKIKRRNGEKEGRKLD